MSYKNNYDPPGVEFVDPATGRRMRLIAERIPLAGWIVAKNDGEKWQLVRKASAQEKNEITSFHRKDSE